MRNRRQSTPGEGGAPRGEGSAARTAFPRLRNRAQFAAAPTGGRAGFITDIGQAGRSGYLST